MLIIPNPLPRRYRHVKRMPQTPMVPTGPVLTAATYEAQTAVTLVFAQPVTVTADAMTAVWVVDGDNAEQYQGDDFTIVSPTTVRVNLYYIDAYTGTGVRMTVTPPTGIADAGEAIDWAGVTDVPLPFAE